MLFLDRTTNPGESKVPGIFRRRKHIPQFRDPWGMFLGLVPVCSSWVRNSLCFRTPGSNLEDNLISPKAQFTWLARIGVRMYHSISALHVTSYTITTWMLQDLNSAAACCIFDLWLYPFLWCPHLLFNWQEEQGLPSCSPGGKLNQVTFYMRDSYFNSVS